MIKTNHLLRRYQVFLSSTFVDLENERRELRKSLNKSNYIVEGMELFPASNKKQWQVIRERIQQSDIYVLVIGDRYGSLAENAKELEADLVAENEAISYTHLEYRYARKCGLPILAFINSARAKNAEVDAFVKQVQTSGCLTARWEGAIDLVTEVLAGLADLAKDAEFVANNGWVQVKSLNTPIDSGDKSVQLDSKIQYVKFISYSDKKKRKEPLYKKRILRLDKDVDVWDEYVGLTINQVSHYIDNFQFYLRTDGDALDFSALLPFIEKLNFSDIKAGAKDTVFNPTVDEPSNAYVTACNYFNGFQDGNTDIATKATYFTKIYRFLVDFTAIPDFENKFGLVNCVEVDTEQVETDITNKHRLIQKGVYLLERENVPKNTVLKFNFKLLA